MTVRDMIDSGIEFQGTVMIREFNQDTGEMVRENLTSLALKDGDDILDCEVKYMYKPSFPWERWDFAIEVAAKEGA